MSVIGGLPDSGSVPDREPARSNDDLVQPFQLGTQRGDLVILARTGRDGGLPRRGHRCLAPGADRRLERL